MTAETRTRADETTRPRGAADATGSRRVRGMPRLLRSCLAKAVLLGLTLGLPAQALAHCGVGLSPPPAHEHGRHHHAAHAAAPHGAAPAGLVPAPGDLLPAIGTPDEPDAPCTIGSPIFKAPRSGDELSAAALGACPASTLRVHAGVSSAAPRAPAAYAPHAAFPSLPLRV